MIATAPPAHAWTAARELLDARWTRRGSIRLYDVAHVVTWHVLGAVMRGQDACHIPRDPNAQDASALSWHELVREALGQGCGKDAHRAARAMEKAGLLEIRFRHPNRAEESTKAPIAYSAKVGPNGQRRGWYRPVMLLRPTEALLSCLGYIRASRAFAQAKALAGAVAAALAGPRPGPYVGQTCPVQEYRQDHLSAPPVLRGGGSGPPESPPEVPGLHAEPSNPATPATALSRGASDPLPGDLGARLANILGADWRSTAGATPMDLVKSRQRRRT